MDVVRAAINRVSAALKIRIRVVIPVQKMHRSPPDSSDESLFDCALNDYHETNHSKGSDVQGLESTSSRFGQTEFAIDEADR